jgi:chaperone BCS1
VKSKPRRPLGSLALPPGVMDALISDVREFLAAEQWYAGAGIPHHRGYVDWVHVCAPSADSGNEDTFCTGRLALEKVRIRSRLRMSICLPASASTIYALAGELGLEIYSLSLAAGHIDDAYLQRLATAVPRDALLLIEDIDCAFPSREDEEEGMGAPQGPAMTNSRGQRIVGGTFMGGMSQVGMRTGVTLSGLLNVIDGVGSDDGRLFFATVRSC